MTTVFMENQGNEWKLYVEGHAGYRVAKNLPKGTDIVCAAISILSQTAVQCFLELSEKGCVLLEELIVNECEGVVRISASLCLEMPNGKQQIENMMWAIRTGFELLEDAYPEYVRIQ